LQTESAVSLTDEAPVLRSEVDTSNEKVLRILEAAHACFSEKGIHGASMKDVADRAGVSKSMLHYYFDSKNHLLLELHAFIFNAFAETIRDNVRRQGTGPAQAMRAIDQLWDFLAAQFPDLRFVLQMWAESTTHPRLRKQMGRFYTECRRLVVWGIDTVLGDMADGLVVPKETLAGMLLAMLDGLGVQAYLEAESFPVDEYRTEMKRFFWQALPTDEPFPG